MLILTRKIDQGIVIQGNILVRVLGVERDRVKIGITAPGEITVLRQELCDEDTQKEIEAAKGDSPSRFIGIRHEKKPNGHRIANSG